MNTSLPPRFSVNIVLQSIIAAALCAAVNPLAPAADDWPPAPPLDESSAAQDAAPLPSSISAEPIGGGEWRCTFRYRSDARPSHVALVGSFNGWNIEKHPMSGPNDQGDWTVEITLSTGVHEYKFVIDGDTWREDPINSDRMPDGYGGYNSFVRLGRLANMAESDARLGDGQIDPIGLTHQPPLALYTQPRTTSKLVVRYRTLAHDIQTVWLALRSGERIEMPIVTQGPLFAYRGVDVEVPAGTSVRTPNARSIFYTFVLDDGGERVCDPYTYRYSFTEATLFDAPSWTVDAVGYEILIDRFRNGDPDNDPTPVHEWTSAWFEPAPHEAASGLDFYEYAVNRDYGGDLAGLAEALPYLEQLGVNVLYLSPVFKAPSHHKYDVQSFVHVDDHFGVPGDYDAIIKQEDLRDPSTWQWTASDRRFLDFIKQAHARGFRIVIDTAFNYVGAQHPAFQDVMKNRQESRYANWFDVISWEPLEYRTWSGFEHLPLLKTTRRGFASRDVRQHIFAITRRWMDPDGDGDPRDGIDGWRVDVPHGMPSPFWVQWRKHVKRINPDALITAVVWHRADAWLDGRYFDAVSNYEFARLAVSWVFDQRQRIATDVMASETTVLRLAYPQEATYASLNLVDNHNTDRLASMAQNPDRIYDRQNRVQDGYEEYDNSRPSPQSYARARLAALLQMTYVGTPLVYYGDEVGMWGADDPTNRKPMLWEDLAPYDNPDDNFVMDEQLAHYRAIIGLRNTNSALRNGTMHTLHATETDPVWVFLRQNDEQTLLIALNPAETSQTVTLTLPPDVARSWKPLFGTAQPIDVKEGTLKLSIPEIAGVVLRADE